METTKKSPVIPEYLWTFFSSVRTGIILLALVAVGSILGSLIPQDNTIPSNQPALFYAKSYGAFGKFMYALGFTHMYTSVWFIALLVALGISLIVASWERFVPLYKSLRKQPITVQPFLLKTRGFYQGIEGDSQDNLREISSEITLLLRKRRYKIRTEQNSFLAEKGRFARFGAYVIHTGLLLIIAGCMMRLIPGFYYTGNLLVDEGQTLHVPSSDFSIRNDRASEEQYADGRPKFYETQATVIQNGKEVFKTPITVNHPLKYHGIILFQAAMLPLQYKTMEVSVVDQKNNNNLIGSFRIDFNNPQKMYSIGDYKINLLNYYPDFQGLGDNKEPTTKSSSPYAPAFILSIKGPGITSEQRQWFVPSAPFLQAALSKQFQYNLIPTNVSLAQTTGLRVQKDYGIPVVYAGCVVVILGLVTAFYFQHRRIWGNLQEGVLHLGGQTNKNKFAFQKEIERILVAKGIEPNLIRTQGGKA